MKLLHIKVLILIALIVFTSCSKDEGVDPVATLNEQATESQTTIDLTLAYETDWDMADAVLDLINDHRISIGLNELQKDQQHASAYAVDHTKYMISKGKISHDNYTERANGLKSIGATSVGENVAFGYDTAEKVVNAWLNSPTHRNVIESNYTHTGFGILTDSKGVFYFTQLFYRK